MILKNYFHFSFVLILLVQENTKQLNGNVKYLLYKSGVSSSQTQQTYGPVYEISDFSTNCITGLQIRGGKGYFSIDFLEFSIEN